MAEAASEVVSEVALPVEAEPPGDGDMDQHLRWEFEDKGYKLRKL